MKKMMLYLADDKKMKILCIFVGAVGGMSEKICWLSIFGWSVCYHSISDPKRYYSWHFDPTS